MTVQKGTAWHDGKHWSKRSEVFVVDTSADQIEYRDIYGWSYGWAKLADYHTMDRGKFERTYTHKIDLVQGF